MQPNPISWSTPALQAAWASAPFEARHLGHPYLGVEHLLIALSRCEGGYTARLIERLHLDPQTFRALLRRAADGQRIGARAEPLPQTPRLQTALSHARELAHGEPIDEKSCLVALLNCDGGVFVSLCEELDWPREELVSAVTADSGPSASSFVEPLTLLVPLLPLAQFLQGDARLDPPTRLSPQAQPFASPFASPLASPAAASQSAARGRGGSSALDEFGRDLTAEARAGRLAEAFGRQDLLVRMAQVLAHDTANNPVLVGEAGVGKTALVEGLAWRLAQPNRPIHPEYRLDDARIVEISLARLTAGTEYRGAFEQRIQRVIDEASADPRIIIFFDEVHTLVGAGRAGSSGLDAAQILKPALARGAFRCIGATTSDEFDRVIAGDEALARRFERIDVPEPSEDLMLDILRRWRPAYTQRYSVFLPDDTLLAAVRLSTRYLPARHLPEKALKVLDNARVLATVGGAQLSVNTDDPALPDAPPLAPVHVTVEHIAQAITAMTGIPVSSDATPHQALLKLPELLADRVKGQDAAIRQVSAAIQSSFAGLHDPQRPRAVLLFVGPTGVGKTEVAATLASAIYQRDLFKRLDMAEFAEAHTDARLIGAPPGYVGHDHGGELTDWLRNHPHSLVLLDEIDKAHDRVRDLLLGLFDAGRMTDGRGREVSGRDAVFIMTANFPLRASSASGPLGFALGAAAGVARPPDDRQLRAQLREFLRAEFVSRIDEVILFQPLSPEAMEQIVSLRLAELIAQLTTSSGVSLQLHPDVTHLVLQQATAPGAGAREIGAAIRRLVFPPLSQAMLSIPPGAPARIQLIVNPYTNAVEAQLSSTR